MKKKKKAAYYAKIDRVGSLDAGFQQVPLVCLCWGFKAQST